MSDGEKDETILELDRLVCLASKLLKEKDSEIERLQGLIEKMYKGAISVTKSIWEDVDAEIEWQQFKTENNIKP